MTKVKEEFFLSLIFLGKWLALGLGVFGILYLTINVAYNKTYYEPRMATFDLKIQELVESKTKFELELVSLRDRHDLLIERISLIEQIDIPNSEATIEAAKGEIGKMGLRWWEQYDIPLISRNPEANLAYRSLAEAESANSMVLRERDNLKKERDSISSDSNKLTTNIRKIDEKIAAMDRKKRKAQVDVKGPLFWLIGLLGLT